MRPVEACATVRAVLGANPIVALRMSGICSIPRAVWLEVLLPVVG